MKPSSLTRLFSPARRRRLGVLAAAGTVLLCAGALAGSALGPSSKWTFRGGGSFNRWEYAEFSILPDRALVVGDTAVQEILPPRRLDDRDTVYENDAGRFIERFDLRLFYINLMGSEGWEFSDREPIKEGRTYMVRRQRR